jgi:predicted ATPase/class 3 adenylate cyclase
MPRDLPSGTVTFCFTDVEGSTRLLHELGAEAYADALAEHRRVIRAACAAEGGVEVDTQGDAFFFAFPTAPGALAAASAFTEALSSGPVQVRVGLHTGDPLLAEEGYVGEDVHLAARIASSAHGGQVVLSGTTAAAVEPSDKVSLGLSFRALGEHRLKDVEGPVVIFQLGEGRFPPLKTISNTNLPRPASSFLGREAELEEVLSRIEHGARLVTLTGPGGTGKTRLALEAAATLVPEFKAGVFWIGLASLRDPALVIEQVAQVLGAKEDLASHISDREMLLLLDNLEQVIECASDLSELLSACPNLTLLVTSRELLRIQGEVEYPVPPLAGSEAVELFCERAQLEPSDEIAELCARLDSLPLAVELAAARCKALTPAQILERLAQRLDLLKGGRDADPRQQTLRATIEWSYELLTPDEQELFARLSVFAGGCTLEAAEDVCDADLDTLQSLVEKSLLRFTPSESGGRYWMLETVREYAAERSRSSGTERTVRDRHTDYFVELAGRAKAVSASPGQEWLDRLEREQDNFRAVFATLLEARAADRLLDLLGYVLQLWWLRGERREGLRLCTDALAIGGGKQTEGCGRVLKLAGLFAVTMGDPETGRDYMTESLAVFEDLDDPEQLSAVLVNLGGIESALGDDDAAMASLEEAIVQAERAGMPSRVAAARNNIGNLAIQRHDFETAVSVCGDVVEVAREAGDDAQLTMPLFNLAFASFMTGRDVEATATAREGVDVARRLGDMRVLVDFFVLLAARAERRGDLAASALLIGAAEGLVQRTGLGRIGGKAETELHEATSERLRVALAERYEQAIADGRDLSVDEAVEHALSSID